MGMGESVNPTALKEVQQLQRKGGPCGEDQRCGGNCGPYEERRTAVRSTGDFVSEMRRPIRWRTLCAPTKGIEGSSGFGGNTGVEGWRPQAAATKYAESIRRAEKKGGRQKMSRTMQTMRGCAGRDAGGFSLFLRKRNRENGGCKYPRPGLRPGLPADRRRHPPRKGQPCNLISIQKLTPLDPR